MTTTLPTQPLSTGRLTTSMPEIQHFPGTPLAEAERRRMRTALAQGCGPFMDFSSIEDRVAIHQFQDSLKANPEST